MRKNNRPINEGDSKNLNVEEDKRALLIKNVCTQCPDKWPTKHQAESNK